MSYSALAVGAVVAVLVVDLAVLRTRMVARPVFWAAYAIDQGHWDYDGDLTLGVRLPGGIPVEEVLFFLVVPVCAVLAFEAVRKVTGWDAGDEP